MHLDNKTQKALNFPIDSQEAGERFMKNYNVTTFYDKKSSISKLSKYKANKVSDEGEVE